MISHLALRNQNPPLTLSQCLVKQCPPLIVDSFTKHVLTTASIVNRSTLKSRSVQSSLFFVRRHLGALSLHERKAPARALPKKLSGSRTPLGISMGGHVTCRSQHPNLITSRSRCIVATCVRTTEGRIEYHVLFTAAVYMLMALLTVRPTRKRCISLRPES